jgi:phosphonoacetaldehyde hydrolase
MQNTERIELIVFDWAGTITDFGGIAPFMVFDKVFSAQGIHLTKEEINKPMGMEKKDHIRTLLQTSTASKQWEQQFGRGWTEKDVDALYETFEEALYSVVTEYSGLIPGVAQTVETLKQMDIKIGSTTGYTSQMMKQVIPRAKKEGYHPDYVVTPDMIGCGRPSPFMVYENMRKFNIYPPSHVVKVGDTVVDILEGKNAGAWSVGILTGSNLMGLSKEETQSLPEAELKKRKEEATRVYLEAGADFVLDTISELPEAIRRINQQMA